MSDRQAINVILIGGSSHTGKSTAAAALAGQLGWTYRATDMLARHPGRPWKPAPEQVPPHVDEHYRTLSVDALIADVLRHYRDNVWPQIEEIVARHATDPTHGGLVLEGSAILPELAAALDRDTIALVWLTADNELFRARIYAESGYAGKTEAEQVLIDKFLARTSRFNQRLEQEIERLSLTGLAVSDGVDTVRNIRDLLGV